MGNTMSCFERWGKRQPDGPLLSLKPSGSKKGSLLSGASTASSLSASPQGGPGARGAAASTVPATASAKSQPGSSSSSAARSARRRPTYSSRDRKHDSDMSEMALDTTSSEESEGSQEELSAKDIRLKKISEYRRLLTKVVKLKTAIFQMTVKVTIARDGSDVLWYSGKSQDDAEGEDKKKKKPAGQFPISKITSTKAKADNPKSVEVSVQNPTFESYSFSFKSREEREIWQQQLESLRKFLSMA